MGFVGDVPKAIGMGMLGRIDPSGSLWDMIDLGKPPVNLREQFEKKYQLPCRLENDVKSATLAEARFGAGKGVDNFIFINMGTGIGGGFVADGRLLRGWQNDSGEIGHITVDSHSDTPCVCGRFGCAEAIASGSGMSKRVWLLAGRYPDSPLLQREAGSFVRAEDIFSLAESGDPLALRIAVDAADAASELILDIIRVTNPRRIILGGGVAGSGWMRRELPKRLHIPVMESVEDGILWSALDPATVGLIGAATVGLSLL